METETFDPSAFVDSFTSWRMVRNADVRVTIRHEDDAVDRLGVLPLGYFRIAALEAAGEVRAPADGDIVDRAEQAHAGRVVDRLRVEVDADVAAVADDRDAVAVTEHVHETTCGGFRVIDLTTGHRARPVDDDGHVQRWALATFVT